MFCFPNNPQPPSYDSFSKNVLFHTTTVVISKEGLKKNQITLIKELHLCISGNQACSSSILFPGSLIFPSPGAGREEGKKGDLTPAPWEGKIKVPLPLLADIRSLPYALVNVFHPDWLIRLNSWLRRSDIFAL